MLKATLNSSLWLINTKNLYSDGDELSVVHYNGLERSQLLFQDHTSKAYKVDSFQDHFNSSRFTNMILKQKLTPFKTITFKTIHLLICS